MAGVITLVAGHGIILYYFSSHMALSAAVVSGVIILFVIKHLGLPGPCTHVGGCWRTLCAGVNRTPGIISLQDGAPSKSCKRCALGVGTVESA
jgi:hypothetical protein